MVMEKIIGFPVCHKTDGMSALFQVMTDVDAAGRVPQAFPAYDKQDTHILISSRTGASWPLNPVIYSNDPVRGERPQKIGSIGLQWIVGSHRL